MHQRYCKLYKITFYTVDYRANFIPTLSTRYGNNYAIQYFSLLLESHYVEPAPYKNALLFVRKGSFFEMVKMNHTFEIVTVRKRGRERDDHVLYG